MHHLAAGTRISYLRETPLTKDESLEGDEIGEFRGNFGDSS